VSDPGRAALERRNENKWTGTGSAPDRFLTISFANARFDNEAVYSDRAFEADADFTNAHFCYPPDFDSVTNASRIDFTGTRISFVAPGKRLHWTRNGRIPVRLRAFRKIAEETKNHDLERDLYIEERNAERGVYLRQRWADLKREGWKNWPRNFMRLSSHLLWIGIMGVYWAFADYGRSFARPFAWLIASGVFSYSRYLAVLAQTMAKAPDIEKYKQAVRMLARSPSTRKSRNFCFALSTKIACPFRRKATNCWCCRKISFRSSSSFSSASLSAIISRSSEGSPMVPLRQSRLSRIRTNSLRNAFSLAPESSFARVWCGCRAEVSGRCVVFYGGGARPGRIFTTARKESEQKRDNQEWRSAWPCR
jgi:hypothetical protein